MCTKKITSVQCVNDWIEAHCEIQILALHKTDCATVFALFSTMPHLGPRR